MNELFVSQRKGIAVSWRQKLTNSDNTERKTDLQLFPTTILIAEILLVNCIYNQNGQSISIHF